MTTDRVPATEAGRALCDAITNPQHDPVVLAAYARAAILAIEAEKDAIIE